MSSLLFTCSRNENIPLWKLPPCPSSLKPKHLVMVFSPANKKCFLQQASHTTTILQRTQKKLAVQFSRIFFVTTLSYPHPKSDSLCPDTGASCTGHLQKSPNRLQSCRHRATPLHLAAVLLTTWGTTGHESWLLAWLPSEKRRRVFTTNPVTSLMFLMNFALC